MKKPLLIALAIAASSLSIAHAQAKTTPAEDLVKQASFYIGFYYNGSAKVPYWRELQKNMLAEVQKLCAGDTNCGYDKGRTVITDYIKTMKDPFTRYMNEEEANYAGFLYTDALTGAPYSPVIGIQGRDLAGQGLVILEVYAGQAAFDAELNRGDLIKTINGQPATLAILRNAEATEKPIALTYSSKGAEKTAQITPKPIFEPLFPSRQSLQGGKVMYIRIPTLSASGIGNRIQPYIRRANTDKAQGVILDLRDSNGGLEDEALIAASPFIKEGGFIFDYRFQGQDLTFNLSNNAISVLDETGKKVGDIPVEAPQSFAGNVVVLVNANTTWTVEELAYHLQRVGRAKVVGETTAGQLAVSGSIPPVQLINDEYIIVSQMRMLNLDKTPFPMAVTPDEVVPEDLAALAAGRDVQLEKALELLGAK